MNIRSATTAAALSLLLFWGCAPAYKNAKSKFDLGEYEKAIPLFQDALGKSEHAAEKGKIHFYIAESYRLSNRMELALDAYQQAIAEKHATDRTLLYYGYALKAAGKYDEAAKQFEHAARISADGDVSKKAKLEIQNIKVIDSLSKAKNDFVVVTNLQDLNSEGSDYGTAIWKDKLVFASTRRGEKVYLANGLGFSDLYIFSITDTATKAGTVEPFSEAINLDGRHEASAAFSKDAKTMVFARSNSGDKREQEVMDVDLYESQFKNGAWTEGALMEFICLEKKWDGSPAFSADGETLYFASEREDGFGGLDIYFTKKTGKNEWSRPKNLGKDVNTPGNEMFPYIDAQGRLYFASDGHGGLGGLDMFVAERKEGVISVRNLGQPFNSPADDFGMVKIDSISGYFTSARAIDGAKGNDDIYHFIDRTPPKPKDKNRIYHYFLAGTTFSLDEDKQEVLPDTKVALKDAANAEVEGLVSGNAGAFQFKKEIEAGKTYKLEASRGQEYLDETLSIVADVANTALIAKMDSVVKGDVVEYTILLKQDISLKKNIFVLIDKGEDEVSLNNILYDLDKYDIRPDAAKELDKLVEFMKRRPQLKVELGSHTDVRGSDEYNRILSENRAKSAVDYIVSQGIDRSRIVAKGYGETDLLIKNATTEAEHQANRRTTVKVIGR